MQQREVDLIDHQCFIRNTALVLRVEPVFELAVLKCAATGWRTKGDESGAAANHLSPNCNVRTGDVPPQHVQPLVPVIELCIVVAFECRASKPQYLKVVAKRRPHCVRSNMGGIRYAIGGHQLSPQSRGSPGRRHYAMLRGRVAIRISAITRRRRPKMSGMSILRGL